MEIALLNHLPFLRLARKPDALTVQSRKNLDILRRLYSMLVRPTYALVIEDNPDVSKMLADALETIGDISVTHAYDGHEAVEKLSGRYDFIWLDLRLPGLSGIELAREIRAYQPATPVIVCSGYEYDPDDAARLRQIGMYIMLTKPVSLDEIRVVLRLIKVHNTPCSDCPILQGWGLKDRRGPGDRRGA